MLWNVVKNVVLVLALVVLYPITQQEFSVIPQSLQGTLLLFVGLIIVAPLIGNFAFSYEFSTKSLGNLILSHSVTFGLMLACGMLLVMLDILLVMLVGNVLVFRLVLLIILLSMIGHDIWDYGRLRSSG